MNKKMMDTITVGREGKCINLERWVINWGYVSEIRQAITDSGVKIGNDPRYFEFPLRCKKCDEIGAKVTIGAHRDSVGLIVREFSSEPMCSGGQNELSFVCPEIQQHIKEDKKLIASLVPQK